MNTTRGMGLMGIVAAAVACSSGGGGMPVGGGPAGAQLDLSQSTPVDMSTPADLAKKSVDLSTPTPDLSFGGFDLAAPTCSQLSLAGAPAVTPQVTSAPAPTPAGGPLTDGVYFLTAVTGHGPSADLGAPPAGFAIRQVLRITGGAIEGVTEYGGLVDSVSGTVTTSGTNLEILFSCPGTDDETTPYTATATTVRIIDSTTGNTAVPVAVHEYTLQ